MKFTSMLLPSLAALFLTSCGDPPVKASHTLPCTWEKSSFKQDRFTEHVYTLGLTAEKESFDTAVLVIATRDGGKDTDWTIRKVEPFRPRWDAPHTRGGIDLMEWAALNDTGGMTYHVMFLDEELQGPADSQGISIREGPIEILGERFTAPLREKLPDRTAKFLKISGLIIDAKYQGRVTEIFCGLVK